VVVGGGSLTPRGREIWGRTSSHNMLWETAAVAWRMEIRSSDSTFYQITSLLVIGISGIATSKSSD